MTHHFREDSWPQRIKPQIDVSQVAMPFDELAERNLRFGEDQSDWIDLFDLCSTESPAGQVVLPDDVVVYMPENYQPTYAYPLIVWICERERDKWELLELMPEISMRNYFGVCVSQERAVPATNADGSNAASLQKLVYQTYCQIREEYNIHTERTYLAAVGQSSPTALNLLLTNPDCFDGIVTIGGQFNKSQLPLAQFPRLRGKRVLMTMRSHEHGVSVADTVETASILHSAGMEVATRIYNEADGVSSKMLSDFNHWMMNCTLETVGA